MMSEEVLRAVFPLLEGVDLASSMTVCKLWKGIAEDDYFWKCLCAKRWPSICKRPNPPTVTYYKLYQTFYKQKPHKTLFLEKTLFLPRICFDDLEFFIDIWTDDNLVFSEVVPASVLQAGIKIPSSGVSDMLRFHLEGTEFKMTLPVEPRFTVPLKGAQTVSVSMLASRKDLNKFARIINESGFYCIDRSSERAWTFDFLDISPSYPFVYDIQAWISLLFTEDGNEDFKDVFGIEMEFRDETTDFSDEAISKEKVLWLLDMLDWK